MRLPFNGRNRITSPFGPRPALVDIHSGIDIVGDDNTTVHSVCDGVVMTSNMITDQKNLTWQWGNYIRIDDNVGNQYYYCHLSQRLVSQGQKILQGQDIGVMGNTGHSFGAHLHFEIRNRAGEKLNPAGEGGILPIANSCGTYAINDIIDALPDGETASSLFKLEIGPLSKGDLDRFISLAQELKVKINTVYI